MNDESGAAFAVGWSGITSDEWRTWRDCRSRQGPNSAAAAISAKTRLGQGAVVSRVCFIRVKITKQFQKRFEPLALPSGRGDQVSLDPFSPEPFEVASALPTRARHSQSIALSGFGFALSADNGSPREVHQGIVATTDLCGEREGLHMGPGEINAMAPRDDETKFWNSG